MKIAIFNEKRDSLLTSHVNLCELHVTITYWCFTFSKIVELVNLKSRREIVVKLMPTRQF